MQQPEQKQSSLCDPLPSSSPLLAVCWRVCLFSMSPPSPCSPSNLSLKTSFLPFIIFFLPTSAAASRGLAAAGESCDLRSGCCCPGEEKGKCVSEPGFLAQLGGQRSTQRWSNQLRPQKRADSFLLGPSRLLASNPICAFFSCSLASGLVRMSVFKAWGRLWLNMRRCGYRT